MSSRQSSLISVATIVYTILYTICQYAHGFA
ncbi:hypothetical protein BN381_390004 [Candidatus Microthrix parvicella RN1]|uniref:Uncharacterized protein n=1 Tax=Candidatus Neomicrothrix parvicella RN1 TaxID=1229780 RepID=R4Z6A9_9ACTN|nr:hypothetical protein BN381_390004 [Candidatus Microthrix parvicella RN1]